MKPSRPDHDDALRPGFASPDPPPAITPCTHTRGDAAWPRYADARRKLKMPRIEAPSSSGLGGFKSIYIGRSILLVNPYW